MQMGLARRARGPKVEGGGGRPGLSCPPWEQGGRGCLRPTQPVARTAEAGVCWPRGAALCEKGPLDGPRLGSCHRGRSVVSVSPRCLTWPRLTSPPSWLVTRAKQLPQPRASDARAPPSCLPRALRAEGVASGQTPQSVGHSLTSRRKEQRSRETTKVKRGLSGPRGGRRGRGELAAGPGGQSAGQGPSGQEAVTAVGEHGRTYTLNRYRSENRRVFPCLGEGRLTAPWRARAS